MTKILKGKILLIVEDEKDLREPLVTEFESYGCKVFQAENGKKAFDIVQHRKIDAVISDIRMSGGDGVELLKNIKSRGPLSPAVMLITGFSDLSKEEAYHLGAEAILAKPFNLDEVDEALVRILTPRETRWQDSDPNPGSKSRIERRFTGLSQAAAAGEFGLGRGGMFLKCEDELPSAGHTLAFDIQFNEGPIRILDGHGLVRWTRAGDENGAPSGCGIDFESLGAEARAAVLAVTDELNTQPYIPNGAGLG